MQAFIQNITRTSSGWAGTILRIPVGLILMAHGAQKLFGAFGGYGLEGTGQWMASIGLEPGYLMALMAGSAEFFGGLALVIGLLVRPAGIALAFTMLIAIFSVHFSNGLFMANNGYEYALTILVVCLSLAFSGAGALSVDKVIAK
ncbi:DoxX family protein [Marinomonas posidonica]|uniref:DoxX family protein n=1 Tax=Marinomonas posidonica (strain CECT 7376 / NCIMB 14433 / IVIA-Po-181) TaxID=491952 RepID=F6D0R4_MARPP|nr:DoxX family protein [Marinomonas posidonica]AEF55946.1 DoxX family protein [Marinomonas posidonica IVIA-Po-181]